MTTRIKVSDARLRAISAWETLPGWLAEAIDQGVVEFLDDGGVRITSESGEISTGDADSWIRSPHEPPVTAKK